MSVNMVCAACAGNYLIKMKSKYKCANCGLLMSESASVINYGEAYADGESLYGEHLRALDRFQTTRSLEKLLLPFEELIIERLLQSGERRQLVDVGCGTGRFLRAVEMAGIDAVGYEVAPVLAERLSEYGRTVFRGGIDEFLASDIHPDVISLLEVVEHLPDPRGAICRLFDRKTPRTLMVVVPSWQSRRRFDVRFALHDEPPNHLTWWSETALRHLLSRPGYSVTVECVPERRRALLGYLARNLRKPPEATATDWMQAFLSPPPFWLFGTAERL